MNNELGIMNNGIENYKKIYEFLTQFELFFKPFRFDTLKL